MKGPRYALQRLLHSTESKLALPSYSGCVLLGLAGFFFIAATNTLSGWLYVMSGVILALMAIALWLVRDNLRFLSLERQIPEPVSVGDSLQLHLTLHNASATPKTLLKLVDRLPPALGSAIETVVEQVPPRGSWTWRYDLPVTRRGIYHWQQVQLRTGAPLGLFWASRQQVVPVRAIVHPQVLPLSHCPLIDQMGRDPSLAVLSQQLAQASPDGMTRSLRPYRWGDSMRLIHWRTSAKLGELRVRELETFTSGQSIVIALDTAHEWEPDAFEQAVSAAATLYFYALRRQLQVSLWTASTGLVQGSRSVLDVLAATNPNEWLGKPIAPPNEPLLWLTPRSQSRAELPLGSRWLLWRSVRSGPIDSDHQGMTINPEEALESQLVRATCGISS
jgi:uncharacterized protein (DUF58 family)